MGIFKKFKESVDRFITKYDVIHELHEIENTNYQSLEELDLASKKLIELEQKIETKNIDSDIKEAIYDAKDSLKEQKDLLEEITAIEKKIEKGEELTPEEQKIKDKADEIKKKKERF